ncbi:MAG: DMT family transporter [Planctomycetota bacterium]
MNASTVFLITSILIGLGAGACLGAQPSVNGSLGKSVAHPLQASLISFASGTAILFVLTVTIGGGFPPKFNASPSSLPWWIWLGGAIGVLMVSTSLWVVPRIGSLPWFAAVMTGQTAAALVLDHFGLLGNPKTPVTPLRILGTVLLALGVFTIVAAKHFESKDTQTDQASSHAERIDS